MYCTGTVEFTFSDNFSLLLMSVIIVDFQSRMDILLIDHVMWIFVDSFHLDIFKCYFLRCYPFNCQNVVKWQQIDNHSSLGAMPHTLFIKCIQLAALGHTKSMERGAYAHTANSSFFFYKRLFVISVFVCTEWRWIVMYCQYLWPVTA